MKTSAHQHLTIAVPPNPLGLSSFDDVEERAVMRVLRRGELSGFAATIAGHGGGPEVRALEEETAAAFRVRYAVAVNSGTSALMCAVGALMLARGLEVAVTPYSMSASVSCILPWGLKPYFADIDPHDYMMLWAHTPQHVKAAVFVDLFGNLPEKYPVITHLVEDAAQAAGATRNGKFAGTFGDIGILSMNKYKTGGVGEGGMVLTDDESYAFNARLIRNHGEVVAQEMQDKGLLRYDDPRATLLGFNFRLPEISAALAREQLKKLPGLVAERQDQAAYLLNALQGVPGIQLPHIAKGVKPAWYRFPLRVDVSRRDSIVESLQAVGVSCKAGYVTPIHHQQIYKSDGDYLPNVGQVEREMVLLACFGHRVTRGWLDSVVKAIIVATA